MLVCWLYDLGYFVAVLEIGVGAVRAVYVFCVIVFCALMLTEESDRKPFRILSLRFVGISDW